MPTTTPHVLLTRFNIPANRVERSIFSPQWLDERMTLFESYTVPSVRLQEPALLSWIVYLAASTPSWLRERIQALAADLPLHPYYLTEPLDPGTITQHIKEVTGRTAGNVTTSNLDNDDGLAADYLTRARAQVPAQGAAAIYLTRGLILHDSRVYLRRDRTNAFAAVVDDVSSPSFRSCWATVHHQLGGAMPTTVRVAGAPAWLQVVHGRNVSNRVSGRLTSPRNYDALFPGLLDGIPEPSLTVRGRNALAQPGRILRDTVLRPGAAAVRRAVGPEPYDYLKATLKRRP